MTVRRPRASRSTGSCASPSRVRGRDGPSAGSLEPPPAAPRQLTVAAPGPDQRGRTGRPSGPSTCAVQFVRHPRARRYVLRVHPDGACASPFRARATARGRSLPAAQPSVGGPAASGSAQRRRRRTAGPWRRRAARRRPDSTRGDEDPSGVTSPSALVAIGRRQRRCATSVVRALRSHAAHELPPRTLELARRIGLRVGRVTIRDQKGRWGSCAASGNISLNWRLCRCPPRCATTCCCTS